MHGAMQHTLPGRRMHSTSTPRRWPPPSPHLRTTGSERHVRPGTRIVSSRLGRARLLPPAHRYGSPSPCEHLADSAPLPLNRTGNKQSALAQHRQAAAPTTTFPVAGLDLPDGLADDIHRHARARHLFIPLHRAPLKPMEIAAAGVEQNAVARTDDGSHRQRVATRDVTALQIIGLYSSKQRGSRYMRALVPASIVLDLCEG